MRFVLHEGKTLDDTWQSVIADQVVRQWTQAGIGCAKHSYVQVVAAFA